MKFREIVAWGAAVAAVTSTVLVVVWPDSTALDQCEVEKKVTAQALYDCAVDLEATGEHCTREGEAAMVRATQIFKCEERICGANGWTRPYDDGEFH